MFYIASKNGLINSNNEIDFDVLYKNTVFYINADMEEITVNKYSAVILQSSNLKLYDESDENESAYRIVYGDQEIKIFYDDDTFSIHLYERGIRNKALRNLIIDDYMLLSDAENGFDVIKNLDVFMEDLLTYLGNQYSNSKK